MNRCSWIRCCDLLLVCFHKTLDFFIAIEALISNNCWNKLLSQLQFWIYFLLIRWKFIFLQSAIHKNIPYIWNNLMNHETCLCRFHFTGSWSPNGVYKFNVIFCYWSVCIFNTGDEECFMSFFWIVMVLRFMVVIFSLILFIFCFKLE